MGEVRKHLADVWIHVGVFRIGWDNTRAEDRPVTVLVVVNPQVSMSASSNLAADDAASACRLVLDRFVGLLFPISALPIPDLTIAII